MIAEEYRRSLTEEAEGAYEALEAELLRAMVEELMRPEALEPVSIAKAAGSIRRKAQTEIARRAGAMDEAIGNGLEGAFALNAMDGAANAR